MKKLLCTLFFSFLGGAISLITSCSWFRDTPQVGLILSEHFNNKLYKDFDTSEYNLIFLKHLDSFDKELSYPKATRAFYRSNALRPILVTRFFANGDLDSLKNYIGRSNEHGFKPNMFRYEALGTALRAMKSNHFETIEEVYAAVADLELNAAQALTKYNNYVYYGAVNPRTFFSRYYVKVERPDSASVTRLLGVKDLSRLLADIQPSGEDYKAFQHEIRLALKAGRPKDSVLYRTLLVNMERSRWKIPGLGKEYVEVNIPDFTLTWFKGRDTVTHMKVCVGGKREVNYAEKIRLFMQTKKLDDKPKNHETPVLLSKFNSIQVNPIWNIPVSIARSEIYYMALKDPFYLSNNNIQVYYKGRLISDPDTIEWSRYPRERLPFQFKQGSGAGNALGKFKFVFESGSSIYLHDTNNKAAFGRANRAISHGCVRVEDPLNFARHLVKDNYQFDDLRMEVNLPPLDTGRMEVYRKHLAKKADSAQVYKLKPKWFSVKKDIFVLINYRTAWVKDGALQLRPDVYGLDEALWEVVRKFV